MATTKGLKKETGWKMNDKLYFDGGAAPTNPGIGYGTYEIGTPHTRLTRSWKAPHTKKTNNEAEYLTLWLALHDYLAKFNRGGTRLEIFSDSKLVVEQVSGRWKVKNPRMKAIHGKIISLLARIPYWSITWNSREVNVEKFGH